MFIVVDRLRADVQTRAGRDDGGLARFHVVVDGACGNAQVITINAAGTDVIQDPRIDFRIDAIDQAAIVQGPGSTHPGCCGMDIASHRVVETAGTQVKQAASLQHARIAEVSANHNAGVAVGCNLAAIPMAVVPRQIQGQILLRQKTAIATQAGSTHLKILAGNYGTSTIAEGQAACGAKVTDAQRIPRTDQSLIVNDTRAE